MREAASEFDYVQVLPMFDATRLRHDQHLVGACTFVSQHVNGEAVPNTKGRGCCDCTHFCYTPEFYLRLLVL